MAVNRRNFIQLGVASALAAAAHRAFGRGGRGGLLSTGGGGNFYADPYSSYTSIIADQTYSGTQGATGTRSWNGSTVTGPVYGPDSSGTWQPALTAAAGTNGGAGVRVCVLAGQAWNFGTSNGTTIPVNLTTTSTARFVVQGDPAATASTMPTVTMVGNATVGASALWIGGIYQGPSGGYQNAHVTVRKIRFTGFTQSVGCAGVTAYAGSTTGGSNDDLEVCYCQADTFTCGGSQGESGLVYQTGRNTSEHIWVHHNKAFDIQISGGGVNENHAWVGAYGDILTVEYNEFYGAFNGVRFKGCTSTVPSGNIVRYNYIHDVLNGVSFANGGGAYGPNGIAIYGNLFGWEHYNDTVFYDPTYNTHTIYPTALSDGTLDQLTVGMNNSFYSNTISEVYGVGGYYAFGNLNSEAWSFHDNVFLGLTLGTGNISYYSVVTGHTFTGGSGYTNGTYTNVPLSGGSGTGATANITVSGGVVTVLTMTLSQGQHSYAVNDSLTPSTATIGAGTGCAVTVTSVSGAPGFSTLDYNAYWQSQWYRYSSSGSQLISSFSAWQTSYTNNPTWPDLTFNPDTHGLYIPNLTSPYNTLAGNFPNYSTENVNQYVLASGSPMSTAGTSGGPIGYDASTCGAGW